MKNFLTKWYIKPTYFGRLLNFKSNHPILTKIGLIKGLLNRVYQLIHPIYHEESIVKIKQITRCNNYPTNFINTIIN